jgi:hypothetical protein
VYPQFWQLRKSQFQEEPFMIRNRFVNSMALAAGVITLSAMPAAVRPDSASRSALQTPKTASPASQSQARSSLNDDFAGLDLTDEQRAEIAKIHQDIESHKAAVAKDQKLSTDQKDAMLLGYTRMEYGMIFKQLTPQQQKVVRKRMKDRRDADQATQKKELPAQQR